MAESPRASVVDVAANLGYHVDRSDARVRDRVEVTQRLKRLDTTRSGNPLTGPRLVKRAGWERRNGEIYASW